MVGGRGLGRNQDAYDRFASVVDGPLLILALVWLPVLIWPLVAHPGPTVGDALNAVDLVWAAFVIEYIVKLYLAPARGRFVRHHLLDLAIIVLPFLRPLRAARLLRVGRSGSVLVAVVAPAPLRSNAPRPPLRAAQRRRFALRRFRCRVRRRGARQRVEYPLVRRRALVGNRDAHYRGATATGSRCPPPAEASLWCSCWPGSVSSAF